MHDYDSVHGIFFVVMVINGDGFVSGWLQWIIMVIMDDGG